MVITTSGIVATSQPLASQAGAQILSRGGSAIDAAIAANAVLSVTEPMMDGIGGDLFAIYWEAKTGKFTAINASGTAPAKLTIDFMKDKGHSRMPDAGIHTVTVPGAVDGWDKMHRKFGRLPWSDLFQSAIRQAANGFPVTETIQAHWQEARFQQTIRADENATRVFLPGGSAPTVGQVFRNPELAHAFELIARKGARTVYEGEIAKAIVATSQRLGGTMQASDLSGFQSEWVTPISTTYRGWTVYEMPPNGQGIAALQMLNVLENMPQDRNEFLSAETFHTRIEAMKLAYADLGLIADQRFSKVPIEGMLSKPYAKQRAALLDPERARCSVDAGSPAAGNTVYLAVVDKEGNIASWIQSIASQWGSGVVVDGMGFALQNRGSYFDLDASHPNRLEPGKRPRHSIIPAFMEKGDLRMAFGIMGGSNQPMAHAQFVSNVVDYGMNIQAALEAPRFTKVYTGGCDLMIEGRVPPAVREALTRKGHDLTVLGDYATNMGRGQAVLRDIKTGVNYGASSPRGDGAAIPEPDVFPSPVRSRDPKVAQRPTQPRNVQ
jgi:gamma-glutamyltranspeptidase/glutathione hydrolase